MSDLTILVRDWLRGHGFTAHAGGPVGDTAQIVIYRAGGGETLSAVPTDGALLGVDVWGDATTPSYSACAALKDTLRTLLAGGGTARQMGNTTVLGLTVIGERWLPDPDSNTPRFALTVSAPAIYGN